MHKVQLLSPEIVSKIAAGEVIERPASVVKELLENAVDAKSDAIEINLRGSGRTLIHIKDTGRGITPQDIEKIFHRHATSKISTLDDLFTIHTLGFRGEALYSIAAISDVVLRSKSSGQDSGWEIHLRGGKRLSLKPVAMDVGTELEIKELFFNTPARRKFLKTDATELSQIIAVSLPYTLSHPQTRFLLQHSGKTILDLLPASDPLERIGQALNLNREDLLESSSNDPGHDLCSRMVLGNINIKRSRKDLQFIFVNGRPVQNRNISFHLNDVYRLIFPPEVYPAFVLFLELPPKDIDANVHPTKREVKIKDEHQIVNILRSLTEQTLMRWGPAKEIKSTVFEIPKAQAKDASQTTEQFSSMTTEKIPSYLPFETPIDPDHYAEVPASDDQKGANRFSKHSNEKIDVTPFLNLTPTFKKEQGEEKNLFEPPQKDLRSRLSGARFIGAFIRKYLLLESGTSLFLIDQHAAQERINFENLRRQIETNQVEVQNLLSPLLIRLSPPETLAFIDAQDKLNAMNISVTAWDKETIAIHAHPRLLDNPELTVRQILAERSTASFNYDTLATRACRQSIMTGDKLTPQEADFLLKQLIACADPFSCPHGRPTVVELKERFLDRQFLRV